MKRMLTSIAVALLLLTATGCKKDKDSVSPAPVKPSLFTIKLSSGYLDAPQVDSAYAVWTINNQEQKVKLELTNDSLIAPMTSFNAGSGKMVVQLFSNKKFGQYYKSQWTAEKDIVLSSTNNVTFSGPESFFDASWHPRALVKDQAGHSALVALRPNDPYFLVNDPGHAINKLFVERTYWRTVGGVQQVARGEWVCDNDCFGVPNNTFFTFLPLMIGTKTWNHISIVVLYQTHPSGQGWVISLEHDL